jgi:hypothetical protein
MMTLRQISLVHLHNELSEIATRWSDRTTFYDRYFDHYLQLGFSTEFKLQDLNFTADNCSILNMLC